jgi:drug/metabolite transporter (DMT)-like permease
MIFGGFILAIASLIIGEEWTNPVEWSSKVQWAMVLLVIFGSIIAFTSFNYLLKVVSPEKVATNTYVNPIIALLMGWYFLHEQITLQSIIASAVLLTGVFFVNTKKQLVLFNRFRSKKNPLK